MGVGVVGDVATPIPNMLTICLRANVVQSHGHQYTYPCPGENSWAMPTKLGRLRGFCGVLVDAKPTNFEIVSFPALPAIVPFRVALGTVQVLVSSGTGRDGSPHD